MWVRWCGIAVLTRPIYYWGCWHFGVCPVEHGIADIRSSIDGLFYAVGVATIAMILDWAFAGCARMLRNRP